MLLTVRHRTHYSYDPAAMRVAIRLRLFPSEFTGQAVRNWSVTVNGEEPQMRAVNGYGDDEAVWFAHDGASSVEIVAEGEIETSEQHGVMRGLRQIARPAVFLRRTELTKPDDAIAELAITATEGLSGLEAAHALSAAVSERVEYRPGITGAETSAAEALTFGCGVCQDHAHVLISAARTLGAAARYVVGYLVVGEEDELIAPSTETHAWAEIWVDGLGWVGFDASNRICPTDRYVRLASGLDAKDAAPIRGSVTGMTEETLEAAEVMATAAQ